MPRTGLKTFVYSFSLTLFMILTINGVFWYKTPSKNQEVKIPSKNVLLFLRGDQADPSIKPAPVKKIALTILPEIAASPQNVPSPTVNDPAVPEIIMADNNDDGIIPLDIAPELLLNNDYTVQTAHADKQQEIVYQPKKTSRRPIRGKEAIPALEDLETIGKDLAKRTMASANPKEAISLPQRKKGQNKRPDKIVIPEKAPKITPSFPKEDFMLTANKNSLTNNEKSEAKQLAAAEKNEPQSIFPLQKDDAPGSRDFAVYDGGKVHTQNKVALAGKNVPINSMLENPELPVEKEANNGKKWKSMAEKNSSADSPWVVAKGAVAPVNRMIANETYYKNEQKDIKKALAPQANAMTENEIQLAAGTVKNLLIPIPEDILNDENLTPQLVSSKKPEEMKKEAAVEEKIKQEIAAKEGRRVINQDEKKTFSTEPREKPLLIKREEPVTSTVSTEIPQMSTEAEKKNSILSSLSTIFRSESSVKEAPKQAAEGNVIDGIKKKIRRSKSHGKIMPTEMRLSFQPNRAEISGQTLRWIQAFASRAADDATMGIEIRIDGTSAMDLQQKRLNLLHNILTNKGVEYSKINTVFTSREPNSFIIRTISLNFNNAGNMNGNFNKGGEGYYLQW